VTRRQLQGRGGVHTTEEYSRGRLEDDGRRMIVYSIDEDRGHQEMYIVTILHTT